MPSEAGLLVLAVSALAGVASVAGGVLAFLLRPSTLVMSTVFGFAGGALLATLTLSMVPQALELTRLATVVVGFGLGFIAVYGFDLIAHGGILAGEHADQIRRMRRRYLRRPSVGATALVFAAATSVEELIEGLTIGVAGVIEPGLAGLVAMALAVDNLSEGMAIGAMFRADDPDRLPWRRMLVWTGTVGLALVGSAALGFALGDRIDPAFLGFLVAAGAGAMLYLTLGDLLPEGQARQFQQSTAISAGIAFLVVLVVSRAVP